MTISDEKKQILRMIQDGQITAEEGGRLMAALESVERKGSPSSPERGEAPDQIRIQISDLDTGKQKVNFSMPLSMVNIGIKLGARLAMEEVKLEDFIAAAQEGVTGKIAEMRDEEGRERVEVFLE
ncbi:MAG: hypothetical protein PVI59_11600 [Anaerolineae bacterium]|jgi:hypothetical protein